MVPSGTADWAAACTLVAVSPVRRVSVMPLAVCPPWCGSWRGGGGAGAAWAGAVEVAARVLVVLDVSAVAAEPISDAPRAPPRRVEPANATPMRALRAGFIEECSFVLVTRT